MARRVRFTRGMWFALYVLVLALVAAGVVVAYQRLAGRLEGAEQAKVERDQLAADVDALRAQVERQGEVPVAPPAAETVSEPNTPPSTTTQPPPPTSIPRAQLAAAIDRFLADNPPADGRPPTTEEIVSAVVAVCSATGGCNGRDGRDAPAPTAAQIQAAVAAWCSDGRCRGPAGEDGEMGAAGRDGVTPPCMSAPEQCQGQSGAVGPMGPQGGPGPAPASWTFTVGLTTYTCVDTNGDLAYECTGQTVSPP